MELFLLEHKKLWRKTSTRISVFLCFLYVVVFGSILSFQWFGFGSSDDYTSAFGNNFDGYSVIRDSQEYSMTFEGELTEKNLQQMVRDYQSMESAGMEAELDKTDWQSVNNWLGILYPELRDAGKQDFLENSGLAVGNIVSQIFFLGTAGWDMPVQLVKMISIAPMNMLQAEIYEYVFTFLGAIGYAGVVMFISAKMRSNVLALLFSLAVAYGPMMIVEYLPYGIQKALDFIPLVGSAADIFRTNTFHIFGKYIWSPYLLITVPVLIGILCMPLAVKGWSRRLKV